METIYFLDSSVPQYRTSFRLVDSGCGGDLWGANPKATVIPTGIPFPHCLDRIVYPDGHQCCHDFSFSRIQGTQQIIESFCDTAYFEFFLESRFL